MNGTLLLLHAPRTGGATAARVLHARVLGTDALGLTYDSGHKEAVASLEGEAAVIASHFPFGTHELLEGPYEYATILRDPVERAMSLYHWARQGHDHAAVARSETLGRFVHKIPAAQNAMVKLLSGLGIGFGGKVTEAVLNIALRNLEKIKYVTFTDRLDVWLLDMTELLRLPKGGGRSNVAGASAAALSEADRVTVLAHNRWDAKLYRLARDLKE